MRFEIGEFGQPAFGQASGRAFDPASGKASGPAFGPASDPASDPASGPASGPAFGPALDPTSGEAGSCKCGFYKDIPMSLMTCVILARVRCDGCE